MGKDAAKKSEQLQSEAANRFSKMAGDLTAESSPARQQVQDYYSKVVKGGPEAYKLIAPQVDYTKTAFATARRAATERVPMGGQIPAAQNNLAAQEAATKSGLFRDKINEALQALTQIGQFGTSAGQSAIQGVSGAGTALGQLAAQRLGAWMSGVGGLANAFGTYFGMKAER